MEVAYSNWQRAKPPTALTKRMLWAEEALQRVKKAEAKAEAALDDLDEWYNREREKLVSNLEEARRRTEEKAQFLAELSNEAADDFDPYRQGGSGSNEMLWTTFKSINDSIGPMVENVLQKLPADSEQHKLLSNALAAITEVHGNLADATGLGASADVYDIAYEDKEKEEEQATSTMDTSDVQVPKWMRRGEDHPTPHGKAGASKRWRLELAREVVQQQALQQDLAAANGGMLGSTAAAAAATAATTAAACGGEQEALDKRRREIIAQSKVEGVDVPESYLAQLCADALEEWAKENLCEF